MDPKMFTAILLCIVLILMGAFIAEYSAYYEKHTINTTHIEYNALNRTLKINNETYKDVSNLTFDNGTITFYTREENHAAIGISSMLIAGGVMGIIAMAMRRWNT